MEANAALARYLRGEFPFVPVNIRSPLFHECPRVCFCLRDLLWCSVLP